MIIYLDTNIVRYVAAFDAYILGETETIPTEQPRLAREIRAIRRLVELDQLADWGIACSPMLMKELFEGNRAKDRRAVYKLLVDAWEQSGNEVPDDIQVRANSIESSLSALGLDGADRRHLAEAIAIGASWLLTNDDRFVGSCRKAKLPLRVSYVSECLDEISRGLFLR